MPGEEERKEEGQKEEEEQKEEQVTLSKTEYAEMVNKMNQMQGAIESFLEKETEKDQRSEQEKQAQRAREEAAARGPVKDLDLMTNKEFAVALLTEVENRVARPLLQMVSTLAVKDEKRDLEKYCDKNGDKFEDYEEEVFKIATEKPTLSLMEAFKLAKAGRKGEEKKEEKKEEKEKGPAGGGGEKPSGGKFKAGGNLTLDQAAKRAFDELKDNFPD